MVEVIAKKRIGRSKPGDVVRLPRMVARAIVALGVGAYRTTALVSAPTVPVKRQYRTRAVKAE